MPNDQIAAAVKVLSRTVIYPHEAEALETLSNAANQAAPVEPAHTALIRDSYSQQVLHLSLEEIQTMAVLLIHRTGAETLNEVFDEYIIRRTLEERGNYAY
jgi:hypothetical protein